MKNDLKSKIKDYYNNHRRELGIYLINNCVIAAIILVVIIISMGTKTTFSNVMEWICALPPLSLLIIAIRLGLKSAHKIVPVDYGIIRIIIDIFVFATITYLFGEVIGAIPFPENYMLQILIAIIFNAAYITLIVFLLKQKKEN